MHDALPPLTALRAFEAVARHLSVKKAAEELHVSAAALSHHIRGLEEFLGAKLFERRVRSLALTYEGKLLYPGLQHAFLQIREAIASLQQRDHEQVLVISTPPGFAAKWLAPRLYRFAASYPDIDARVSSSPLQANFVTDGVDIAIRTLPAGSAHNPKLVFERLANLSFLPVCNRQVLQKYGPFASAAALMRAPLIHDDTLAGRAKATWIDWFTSANIKHHDISRGLRFDSADHAIDAANQGAGVLLAHDLLAYDDLRMGRLVIPVPLPLRSDRAYYLVYPKSHQNRAKVQSFRRWMNEEIASLDWTLVRGMPKARRHRK